MARFMKKRDLSHGRSPGSLVFIGKKKVENALIRLIDYTPDTFQELEPLHVTDFPPITIAGTNRWIALYGLHDTTLVREIGALYEIHPLVLEDIVNTGQRSKIEEFDNYVFIVVKLVRFDEDEEKVQSDQLSLLFGADWLLSFHEAPSDSFKPLRERFHKQNGRLRSHGIGYLAYAILDMVEDHYMLAAEALGSKIEGLEDLVLEEPTPEILDRITAYKREITFLRKTTRPVWELIEKLGKLETDLNAAPMQPFLSDLSDHSTHVKETLDTYAEMLLDQLNIYHSSVSNRINEVMKVLTIFAAIFLPLTLIAGIYGTNFEYLPELHFKYSYYIFLGIMIVTALVMIRYFKKKGWL